MKYRDRILSFIKKIKSAGKDNQLIIPIKEGNKTVAQLKIITSSFTDKDVKVISDWRRANDIWFSSQFRVTNKGTKNWLKEQVISAQDRLLFWIQTPDNYRIGYIGLYRFDFKNRTCEIDNVIRGRKNVIPGVMTIALNALLEWSFSVLKIRAATLRVFSDNQRAIALYKRCGFKEIRKIPLKRIIKGEVTQWIKIDKVKPEEKVERYHSQMYYRPLAK